MKVCSGPEMEVRSAPEMEVLERFWRRYLETFHDDTCNEIKKPIHGCLLQRRDG